MDSGFLTFIGFFTVIFSGISLLLFSPGITSPTLTIQETAQFLEKNPKVLERKEQQVTLSTSEKPKQITSESTSTPTSSLLSEEPIVAAGNLKQSFLITHPDAISERLVLLNTAFQLSQVSSLNDSPSLSPLHLLAGEAEKYLGPLLQGRDDLTTANHLQQYEYGERALQLYLISEKNTEDAKEQMKRMKIPVIDLRTKKQ